MLVTNKEIITCSVLTVWLLGGASCWATSSAAPEVPGRRRVWVRYAPGTHDQLLGAIQQQGASVVAEGEEAPEPKVQVLYDFSDVNSVVLSATEEEIAALREDPLTVSIEDDPKRYPIHPVAVADLDDNDKDPSPLLQWTGQAIAYGLDMIQATQVQQELGLTGRGVKVCVIDSGFDTTHPDLIQSNSTGTSLVSNGQEFAWDDDYQGHGTHVSGIIAMTDNEEGLLGVAPDVTLHHVRIFDQDILGTFVYASALVDAAYACRDAGANIINMSLGGPQPSEGDEEAFRDLYANHNILSISSAGNDGNPVDWFKSWYVNPRRGFPAAYPVVMSVGAVNWRKQIASFSSYHHTVDIAAPGVAVWSTIPTNDNCEYCQIYPASEYASLSGTSMAAPHVAGAAALLWSHDLTAGADFIRNALLASTEDLGVAGRDDFYGYGLVQVRTAFDVLTATLSGDRELQDWPEGPSDFYYDYIHPIFQFFLFPILFLSCLIFGC